MVSLRRWGSTLRIPSILVAAVVAGAPIASNAQSADPLPVVDASGAEIAVFDPSVGRVDEIEPAEGAAMAPVEAALNGFGLTDGVEVVAESSVDPESGREVLSDGTVLGEALATSDPEAEASRRPGHPTIVRFTTRSGYTTGYRRGSSIFLMGSAATYTLSDGTSWRSGAGVTTSGSALYDRTEVDGDTVRHYLRFTGEPLLYRQTDYDSGDHSSAGTLHAAGELYLEATIGSPTAHLRGGALIVSNDFANYQDERFNHWDAIEGSVVPFSLPYTLVGGVWNATTFQGDFDYRREAGWVDFANPISTPRLVSLAVQGPGRIAGSSTVEFFATGTYDNGVTDNFNADALWTATSPSIASVDAGRLTVGAVPVEGIEVTITAILTTPNGPLFGSNTVEVLPRDVLEGAAGTWPTFQGNRRHDGYVPMQVDPDDFRVRFERAYALEGSLHPVAAGDGMVFATVPSRFRAGTHLVALDARDGEVVWSRDLGEASSVNPPAYLYGTVYVQTGKSTSSAALPPLVRAFDGETGDEIWRASFGAQWERYKAPTPFDGHVYVNGGYYGGMYSFDAFTGENEWFARLPQYDNWTPAVDDDYAYAYVGGDFFAIDRATGEQFLQIDDPGWNWRGYDMDLAPVLGGRDDVFVINGGRLIRFDLETERIGYVQNYGFDGQPSIRDGVVYGVTSQGLTGLDQETGTPIWNWSPGLGRTLVGQMIVTDSHIFVGDGTRTYAVEIASRRNDWTIDRAGHMSLADDTLYIANAQTITAVSMPAYIPVDPVSMSISGPSSVPENSTADYTAWVTYEDGRVRERTALADWQVDPATIAAIDEGILSVPELFVPEQDIEIVATYSEDDVVVMASADARIVIDGSIDDFIRRNLEAARLLRSSLDGILSEARQREEAALAVLDEVAKKQREGPPTPDAASDARGHTAIVLKKATLTEDLVAASINELDQAVAALDDAPKPDPGDDGKDDEAGAAAVGAVDPATPASSMPEKWYSEGVDFLMGLIGF